MKFPPDPGESELRPLSFAKIGSWDRKSVFQRSFVPFPPKKTKKSEKSVGRELRQGVYFRKSNANEFQEQESLRGRSLPQRLLRKRDMQKSIELKQWLAKRTAGGIALAFSGGTDSATLLAVLNQLREETSFPLTAITFRSVFQKSEEIDDARRIAERFDVPLRVVEYDPLSIPELQRNPPDRCYWCKRRIFQQAKRIASECGMNRLFDGTNADDRKTNRPGLRALREFGVESPLAECGIGKSEVRAIARSMGLDFAEKPAAPCMATRFEYGVELNETSIREAAAAEEELKRILPEARDLRLRVHGVIARIEVPLDVLEIAAARHAEIVKALRAFRFAFAVLDLNGFASGSMDALQLIRR